MDRLEEASELLRGSGVARCMKDVRQIPSLLGSDVIYRARELQVLLHERVCMRICAFVVFILRI